MVYQDLVEYPYTGKEPSMNKYWLLWFPLLLLLLPACSQLVTFSAPDCSQPVCLGYRTGLADSLRLDRQSEFSSQQLESHFLIFFLFPPLFEPIGGNSEYRNDLKDKLGAALHNDPRLALTGLKIDTNSRMFFLSCLLLSLYGDFTAAGGSGQVQRLPEPPPPPAELELGHE